MEKPELKIEYFDSDVITTSGPTVLYANWDAFKTAMSVTAYRDSDYSEIATSKFINKLVGENDELYNQYGYQKTATSYKQIDFLTYR